MIGSSDLSSHTNRPLVIIRSVLFWEMLVLVVTAKKKRKTDLFFRMRIRRGRRSGLMMLGTIGGSNILCGPIRWCWWW